MKTSILLFLLLFFQTLQVHSQSECGNFKVKLYTHWYHGWNGHSLAIKINNNVVYPNVGETWVQGHVPFEFEFPVQANDVISTYFKRNGQGWANDCKYEVYDNNNNLIATRDGAGSGSAGGPENVYGLLACPSASKCGTFTVELIDGYGGNGWGGSSLDVYINNSLYVSGTHQDLSYAWVDAEDISFAVEANDKIDIIYNPSSNPFDYYYDAYKVFDTQGNLIQVVSNQGNSIPLTNLQRIFACPNHTPSRPIYDLKPKEPKGFMGGRKSTNFNIEKPDFSSALLSQQVEVFPIPSKNEVFICSKENFVRYELFDLNGRVVLQNQLDDNSIDIRNLEINIYYLRLFDDSNYYIVKKIVKN